jgi:hypothetical protein
MQLGQVGAGFRSDDLEHFRRDSQAGRPGDAGLAGYWLVRLAEMSRICRARCTAEVRSLASSWLAISGRDRFVGRYRSTRSSLGG